MIDSPLVARLASTLVLGSLLEEVRVQLGSFELVAHWTQGEFHHDVVLRLEEPTIAGALPGPILVVATNCNGGVKEVLSFSEIPDRGALWSLRCPSNPEFTAPPAKPLARSVTVHWFDPCELLEPDARSELLPEHRERQSGGGWICSKAAR